MISIQDAHEEGDPSRACRSCGRLTNLEVVITDNGFDNLGGIKIYLCASCLKSLVGAVVRFRFEAGVLA